MLYKIVPIIFIIFFINSKLYSLQPPCISWQDSYNSSEKMNRFLVWVETTKGIWDKFKQQWFTLLDSDKGQREQIYNQLLVLFELLIRQHDKMFTLGLEDDEIFAIGHCFTETQSGIIMLRQIKDDDFKMIVLTAENLRTSYCVSGYTNEIEIIVNYLEEFRMFKQIVVIRSSNKYRPDFKASKIIPSQEDLILQST